MLSIYYAGSRSVSRSHGTENVFGKNYFDGVVHYSDAFGGRANVQYTEANEKATYLEKLQFTLHLILC